MDFSTDNNRWNTTRKKYILSLKNRYQNKSDNVAKSKTNDMDDKELFAKNLQSVDAESGDSQNFSLRLSDSFIVNDTIDDSQHNNVNKNNEKKPETEIIIISDSSDDECSNIMKPSKKNESSPNTKASDSKLSMMFSSIDISDIWTDDERKSATSQNKNRLIDLTKNDVRKYSILTLDESKTDLNDANNDKNNAHNINLNKVSHQLTPSRHKENSGNTRTKPLQDSRKMMSILSSNSKTATDVNTRHNVPHGITNSAKCIIPTKPLTKTDTRNIARLIKSKSVVYNSPGQWQRQKKIINSDADTSEDTNTSEEFNSDRNKVKHPAWINETDSDNDEITQDNKQPKSTKLSKTHVSRFLDPETAIDTSMAMSDRKKEEISRWLLSHPIDSRSDTSLSYVPCSERNSVSSGNSSLDRLEQKYETPNNRDKFTGRRYIDSNKTTKFSTPARQIQSAKVRQTTIDSFLRKIKRGDKSNSYHTPMSTLKDNKMISSSPPVEDTCNLQIADCADILDKLYGNVWRDKANDLLPASQPRKMYPKLQNCPGEMEYGEMTKPKKKQLSFSVSDLSKREEIPAAVKPHLNSIKKSKVKNKIWRQSFINDHLSSGCSDGETTYQTALSTPHTSNLRNCARKDTPMTALTKKAIEICDSDSENDNIDIPDVRIVDNRRKLSFSDDEYDEKSSSGTSEYDPHDVIPPKSVVKSTKVIAQSATSKSFLASLSSSVAFADAHPLAIKYRMNYADTKNDLCKYLYKLYNDKIFDNKLPDNMLIQWNIRMRGAAGFCYNRTIRKALGTPELSSRIDLATKIVDTPDRLRDTLVHEMCHAATWMINKMSDGHGHLWQAWASKAMKVFPELPSIKRCHDYKIKTKFTYRCVNCGYSVGRHSKSLDVTRKRCGHCYGKFELYINKITKSGTVQVKTVINRQPSGFALFVKENYRSVKEQRRNVKHKEVMQILGQQFSAVKITNKNNNMEN